MTKLIINCETGEIVERELNKAEKDQQKTDEAALLERQALEKAEADAKLAQKQGIADRLGLTLDELKLLLG